MDECGRLQRVAGSLPSHPLRRQSPQFLIDQWQQVVRCFRIPILYRLKNACDVANVPILDDFPTLLQARFETTDQLKN